MSGERYQPHIDALLELVGSLPERVNLAGDYKQVAHIAHGWFRRCVRGVQALLVLQEAGHAGEASPLARSVVEHQVALAWLVAEGRTILDPLKRGHGREAGKLFAEWSAAQQVPPDSELLDSILESVADAENASLDFLLHFAARVERWGTQTDKIMYQGEVMRSHATFQSASAYYNFERRETLLVSKEGHDYRHFAAVYLFRSASTFDRVLLGSPWAEDLAEIEEGLSEISADIAAH